MHRRQFSPIGGMGKSIFSGSKHKGQVIQVAAGSLGMHSLQWTTQRNMLISTVRIPLSSMQKRVAEATCISRRRLCRIVKEGEGVENSASE
jgi:hypothetical protein